MRFSQARENNGKVKSWKMERLAEQMHSEQIVEKKVLLLQKWQFHRDLNFNILCLCLSVNYFIHLDYMDEFKGTT